MVTRLMVAWSEDGSQEPYSVSTSSKKVSNDSDKTTQSLWKPRTAAGSAERLRCADLSYPLTEQSHGLLHI